MGTKTFFRVSTALTCAITTSCIMSSSAWAQTAPNPAVPAAQTPTPVPPPTEANPQGDEQPVTTATVEADVGEQASGGGDIVVTGSRISGFTAPTPTTVIGAAEQQRIAAPTIADVLNRLPSFGGAGPTSTASTTANPGANILNLRGIGATRTLVLVDGRRHVPTNGSGTIDINLLPSALIQRVDVVTGGASAAYGSDAVAGVVNVILEKEFTGVKGSVQGGVTQRGDDKTFRTSLAWGRELFGGKGHLMVAGEFTKTWDTPYYGDRHWAKNYQILSSTLPDAGVSSPIRLVPANVTYSNSTLGGLINAGPLRGTQFLPGGVSAPFQYGSNVGTAYMQGGGGDTLTQFVTLDVPQERGNLFGRLSYEYSPALKLTIDVSYARSSTLVTTTPPTDTAITIRRDNAYLPADVRARMTALNLQTFSMGRLNLDLGLIQNGAKIETNRIVTALEGDLGDGWQWNAYSEFGLTDYRQRQPNNRNTALWLQGVDAVVAPAGITGIAPGSIVCRSTLTDTANGCLPINIFGNGSPDSAALARIKGTASFRSVLTELAGAANISGKPVQLPAGPLSVAAGVEYRRVTLDTTVDPISARSGWRIGNFKPVAGQYDVKEVYGEVRVPILADQPFARDLSLNAAGRYTSYSISGDVQTWKAGLTYAVDPNVSFRGGISRDIRAPNLAELFQTGTQLTNGLTDRFRNNQQYNVQFFTGGNRDLTPERATTKTVGIVLTPEFIRGFRFSADYYDVKIGDAIVAPSIQQTVDLCFRGATQFCGYIVRSPATGLITRIDTPFLNVGTVEQRGLDLEAVYDFTADAIASGWNGKFQIRTLATHLFESSTSSGTVVQQNAGQVPLPKWKLNGRFSYDVGRLGIYAEGRYVSSVVYDNTFGPLDIARNDIGDAAYVTLSASYDLVDAGAGKATVFAVVDNLFDADPRIAAQSGFNGQTYPAMFDVLGRRFTAGVRFSF